MNHGYDGYSATQIQGKCVQYEQMYDVNAHRLHPSCVVNYLMVMIITEEKQLNLCSLGNAKPLYSRTKIDC